MSVNLILALVGMAKTARNIFRCFAFINEYGITFCHQKQGPPNIYIDNKKGLNLPLTHIIGLVDNASL